MYITEVEKDPDIGYLHELEGKGTGGSEKKVREIQRRDVIRGAERPSERNDTKTE